MFPIRNLYPLSGFRILVAAYAHALNMEEPINPQNFVVQYGKQRFGLSDDDAQKLWRYLAHDQLLISPDTVRDEEEVEAILNHFKEIKASIHNIMPARNQDEFKHFMLMGDIREFYLSVIKIQAMVESPGFERDQMEVVGERLNTLKGVSEKLNGTFMSLNKGYLHDVEIKRLNRLRNKRLNNLRDIYC